ncbi:MAG: hypothetical protein M1557_02845 [Actinobacteria bacterium]|nr:hypothetical protein [Actinomycetota bacterium]
MKLKLDTAGATFLAATGPEPVLDRSTNAPRLDKDGRPIHMLQIVTFNEDGAEVLPVKVGGKPVGIVAGTAVKVTGLVATPWSMGERNGISFTAERIEAVGK